MATLVTLPSDNAEWTDLAEEHKVKTKSIHSLSDYKSASKIPNAQFLALRVLWETHGIEESAAIETYFDTQALKSAQTHLKATKAWQDYLKVVAPSSNKNQKHHGDIGAFSLVIYNQRCISNKKGESISLDDVAPKISWLPDMESTLDNWDAVKGALPESDLKTPTSQKHRLLPREDISPGQFSSPFRPPRITPIKAALQGSTDPAEDEQIVNTALLLFLQALTINHPDILKAGYQSPQWSLKRQTFKLGSWQARTDGILRNSQGIVRAIIEVKPGVRKEITKIQMQESAQMAAWIYQCPLDDTEVQSNQGTAKTYWRVLVSQDCKEIYLIFAEYSDGYKDYLIESTLTSRAKHFMTMKQFGPWNIEKESHMRYLGIIILALTLQHLNRGGEAEQDPFVSLH